MDIKRIDSYKDDRFSQRVLMQHGCFLADGKPYEVEIISGFEAVVRGENPGIYTAVIDEFRFYTPHITRFYDGAKCIIKEWPPAEIMTIPIDQIQPSQFFVDEDKIAAIGTFINEADDIIIQVMLHEGRYISLDGHTRLYYAVMNGWSHVRAVADSSDDWVFAFVNEAQKRGIYTPSDMTMVSHGEYEEKWNRFCDELMGG